MENRIEDIQYCEKLFDRFYDVGSTEDGGVTRLGYSEQEDEMHAVFSDLQKNWIARSFMMKWEILTLRTAVRGIIIW